MFDRCVCLHRYALRLAISDHVQHMQHIYRHVRQPNLTMCERRVFYASDTHTVMLKTVRRCGYRFLTASANSKGAQQMLMEQDLSKPQAWFKELLEVCYPNRVHYAIQDTCMCDICLPMSA
jgi:hypothetical protein